MKGKNSKGHPVRPAQAAMLVGAVIALTILRIRVAAGGALTEGEAFLKACADHPAGGYVEGAAGVPLLLSILDMLGISGVVAWRWISPLAALPISWAVWCIGRRVAPHRPVLALWAVLGVNLLPPLNLASLVMNGAMVSAALILISVVAGWHAALSQGGSVARSWASFGVTLAVTTLFWLPAGCLLPLALGLRLIEQGTKGFPVKGFVVASALLMLGWVAPLGWNARHDWIGLSSVAAGFDVIRLGHYSLPLGPLVAACAVITPFVIRLIDVSRGWAVSVILAGVLMAAGSGVILFMPSAIPEGLPSPVGVRGLGDVADQVLSLRKGRPDGKRKPAFLIASTPGLAALTGSMLAVEYPERPGAPSVFAAESPSLSSSYALWPSYPDAVAAGIDDTLYTEEKSASPFLGRNALYITTETREELPQTITGAFGAVGLLKEIPIEWNGRPTVIRIYQCEDYRTLSL